tara:strand:+ start:993 stop:1244 length:252 start_codon:yes stop_codon:yes gene_type:complete
MEKVFLTKEEIESITNLQTTEEKLISQLGTIEYQSQLLINQKGELNDSIIALQIDKEKVGKTLQDKYGEGSINTTNGEFLRTD